MAACEGVIHAQIAAEMSGITNGRCADIHCTQVQCGVGGVLLRSSFGGLMDPQIALEAVHNTLCAGSHCCHACCSVGNVSLHSGM